jgi:signal peptidase I
MLARRADPVAPHSLPHPPQMTSHPTSIFRWLGALIALIAVAGLWYELAPAKLGGSHDYAVVDGISMQPKLHSGDLVLMHSSSHYEVGDVVGYHNLQLGRLVLHRIVGKVGDTYVFKGDNNSFLDAYHPTQDQLVGRLSIHVPKVGGVFTWLHAPHHSAITVGIVAFLLLAGGGAGATRRSRRGRHIKLAVAPNPVLGRALLSGAAFAALVFGLVTLIASSHAKTSTVNTPGGYVQQGAYAYSAHVQPNALYPSGQLNTGQTVFTQLVHEIATSFDYRFVSALPHTVSGTASFEATLQSSTGWTKKLPSRSLRFRGDHAHLAGALDVRSLEQQVIQYSKLTGIGNDSFEVVLRPTVTVHGRVGGAQVEDTFMPTALSFALDGFSLRLQRTSPAAQPGVTETVDALHPSQPGVIPHQSPASMKLVVAKVRVTSARWIGLVGLVLAALLAVAGFVLLGRNQGDELTKIRRRGGALLVPVSSPPAAPAGGYVEVANFDSLAHLARSYQLMILHHQRGDAHSFYLDDDGSIYRYGVRAGERHAQAG